MNVMECIKMGQNARDMQRNCSSALMKHFLSEIFQVNDGLSFQATYQLVEIIIAPFSPLPLYAEQTEVLK